MKKATVTTLIGYIVLILVSVYGIKSYLDWFEFAEESSLPASKGMLIADQIFGVLPDFCYAAFFLLVLRNKLNKGLGIAGAALAVCALLFSRIVWNANIDYSLLPTWFYLITNLTLNCLMLLYFCNLKFNWISLKVSSIGACVSFVISWCLTIFSIYQNYTLNVDYMDSFERILTFNLPNIINLIASVMASAFFFAMTKNILKNGK